MTVYVFRKREYVYFYAFFITGLINSWIVSYVADAFVTVSVMADINRINTAFGYYFLLRNANIGCGESKLAAAYAASAADSAR